MFIRIAGVVLFHIIVVLYEFPKLYREKYIKEIWVTGTLLAISLLISILVAIGIPISIPFL